MGKKLKWVTNLVLLLLVTSCRLGPQLPYQNDALLMEKPVKPSSTVQENSETSIQQYPAKNPDQEPVEPLPPRVNSTKGIDFSAVNSPTDFSKTPTWEEMKSPPGPHLIGEVGVFLPTGIVSH